jgi:hypothetical protein
MTQTECKFKSFDDVILELSNLTELLETTHSVISGGKFIDGEGKRIDEMHQAFALTSIARDLSVRTLTGLVDAYAQSSRGDK